MIDVKVAKKLILSEIAAHATADGFKPKLSEQTFSLTKPFGKRIIHISFIPHGNVDIDIVADVAIRIDAVEALVNEGRGNLNARESERTATLGGDIGNLSEGKQRRWRVAIMEDVGPVAASVYTDARRIGGEFFERYATMDNILRVLSSSNPHDWRLSPGHLARCSRAVALAFALGKSEDIENVVQTCEGILRQRDSFALPKFSEFVSDLKMRLSKGNLPKLQPDEN